MKLLPWNSMQLYAIYLYFVLFTWSCDCTCNHAAGDVVDDRLCSVHKYLWRLITGIFFFGGGTILANLVVTAQHAHTVPHVL